MGTTVTLTASADSRSTFTGWTGCDVVSGPTCTVTVNAANVLGRSADTGRLAPGYRADVLLLDVPDWRYLAYHLAGDIVAAVVKDGQVAYRR